MNEGPLRDVAWLREHLGTPGLCVLDCRFRLGEPGAGERLWRDARIPGAAFLDVDRDLAAAPGVDGRHPLPSARDFEAAARRAGIQADSSVIAYDEAGEGGAARLWWLLRHFGHDDATVLDGGLRGWREAGGPLEKGEPRPAPTNPVKPFSARPRGDDIATAEELAAPEADRIVLDARAPERYRGEVEPVDAVAGHIPGARNLPFADLAPGGSFAEPAELRARFAATGAGGGGNVVAYCGSGVTACTLVLAAAAAGLRTPRLYPGSWSEWSGRGYPVARQDSARSTASRSSGPGGGRSA